MKLEFIGTISQGRLSCRELIRKAIESLEGKRVVVTLAEAKKKRSNNQNAFYWGVVVPIVKKEVFEANGQEVESEDVHVYLKAEVGYFTKMIKLPDGNKVKIVETSTKLSTTDWEVWMEKIRAWAAQFGVQIPLPNEGITNFA